MIGGKTYYSEYIYVGYDTTASGALNWFKRQVINGQTFKTSGISPLVPQSGSSVQVTIQGNAGSSNYSIFINGSGAGTTGTVQYETIFARATMPDGIGLSATIDGLLRYNDAAGYSQSWGEPTAIAKSPTACGRFNGSPGRYDFAFGGLPC